jgi:hypothetical protein
MAPINLPQNCAGVVVACDGQIVGADLFDCSATFRAQWDRLAQAYLFGIRQLKPGKDMTADAAQVRRFLRLAIDHARVRASASGLGEELEIAGPCLAGTGLVYGDRLCHLAAFHVEGEVYGSIDTDETPP